MCRYGTVMMRQCVLLWNSDDEAVWLCLVNDVEG